MGALPFRQFARYCASNKAAAVWLHLCSQAINRISKSKGNVYVAYVDGK